MICESMVSRMGRGMKDQNKQTFKQTPRPKKEYTEIRMCVLPSGERIY